MVSVLGGDANPSENIRAEYLPPPPLNKGKYGGISYKIAKRSITLYF